MIAWTYNYAVWTLEFAILGFWTGINNCELWSLRVRNLNIWSSRFWDIECGTATRQKWPCNSRSVGVPPLSNKNTTFGLTWFGLEERLKPSGQLTSCKTLKTKAHKITREEVIWVFYAPLWLIKEQLVWLGVLAVGFHMFAACWPDIESYTRHCDAVREAFCQDPKRKITYQREIPTWLFGISS